MRTTRIAALIALGALGAQGCSDDSETRASAGVTSTTVGSGAGGGGAGGGGVGGAGGAGGAAVACLDAQSYADVFTLNDSALCVVARYDGLTLDSFSLPTWGRHGGLVTVGPGATDGSVAITRWTAPAGASGTLTSMSTTVDASVPSGAFLGSQAIDLPVFGWTLVSYTDASLAGEVIAIDKQAVAGRWGVDGFYAGAATASMNTGRLLYAGLSALEASGSTNGLYAADTCGMPSNGSLVPNGDPSCTAPQSIDAWGDASGPVAFDAAGNAFAVMTSFAAGSQEARAFAASAIAPGGGATAGTAMFSIPGYGASLAAVAPAAPDPGIVVFQPIDSTTNLAIDPIEIAYTSGTDVMPGAQGTFATLTAPGTTLAFVTDDAGRLWVAATVTSGMTATTTCLVLDRAPM